MERISQIEPEVLEVAENGYNFELGEYISRGWELYKENVGAILIPFLIYMAISLVFTGLSALLEVQLISNIGSLLLIPMSASLIIIIHKVAQGETTSIEDLLLGYKNHLIPIMLSSIIVVVFVVIGFLFLIIPGIYLAIAYGFVSYFIALKNYDFWPAMEASRKVISKKWFSFFAFGLVLGLINVLGILCFGIGLLITAPVSMCAIYFAFSDIVLSLEEHETDLADNLLSE